MYELIRSKTARYCCQQYLSKAYGGLENIIYIKYFVKLNYSLLQDYMPLPPEDCLLRSDSIVPPEFEFTKVECLLFAFHTVSKQVRYYNKEAEVHTTQGPHL